MWQRPSAAAGAALPCRCLPPARPPARPSSRYTRCTHAHLPTRPPARPPAPIPLLPHRRGPLTVFCASASGNVTLHSSGGGAAAPGGSGFRAGACGSSSSVVQSWEEAASFRTIGNLLAMVRRGRGVSVCAPVCVRVFVCSCACTKRKPGRRRQIHIWLDVLGSSTYSWVEVSDHDGPALWPLLTSQDASASGRSVAVGGDGHQLSVWDVAAGGQQLFKGKAGKASRLVVGSWWLVVGDGRGRCTDDAGGRVRRIRQACVFLPPSCLNPPMVGFATAITSWTTGRPLFSSAHEARLPTSDQCACTLACRSPPPLTRRCPRLRSRCCPCRSGLQDLAHVTAVTFLPGGDEQQVRGSGELWFGVWGRVGLGGLLGVQGAWVGCGCLAVGGWGRAAGVHGGSWGGGGGG